MPEWGLIAGFIGYLVVLLLLGIIAYRRSIAKLEDFAVASRAIKGIYLGLSEATSIASAFIFFAWVAAGYNYGITALWYTVFCTIFPVSAWLLIAPRMTKIARDVGAVTFIDYIALRLKNQENLIRLVGSVVAFLFLFLYVAAQYNAVGTLGVALMGIDYNSAVLIGVAVITIYTIMGGLRAVVWTDVLQGILVIITLIVLPVAAISACGGFGEFWEAAKSINPNLVSWHGGMAAGALGLWILSWISSAICIYGQPHGGIRWIAIKDPKECRKAAVVAGFFQALRMFIPVFIGISARVLYGQLSNPESAGVMLIKDLFHPVIAGIMLAGVFAACMSTADSQLLEASTTITRNIYQKLLKKDKEIPDETMVKVSRIAVLIVSIVALITVFAKPESVFTMVQFGWTGLGSALGPIIILSIFWRRLTGWGAIAGMIGGTLSVIITHEIVLRGLAGGAAMFLLGRESFIGFPVGFALTVLVSLLTKPLPEEELPKTMREESYWETVLEK